MRWLLLLSLAFGQPSQQEVNDDNFYGAIYKGMWLVRFTSSWSTDSKQNFYIGKFEVYYFLSVKYFHRSIRVSL